MNKLKEMIRKKRGQVTVFIIIGVLILLTYFLLSHYKKGTLQETELIIPELIPVQQYVMTCTENIARDSIETIGINGGYITFPTWIQNDPSTNLALSPIQELKNPYWWYDGRSAIPTIQFMENQISEFTEANIGECLDNFSAFNRQYTILQLEKFNVITEIGEESVTVKTIFPIEVKDKFNKTLATLQKFPVTLPIRLKRVYDLATEIMERENKDYFIEEKTIDLISLDDQDVPTVGMEVKCGKKRWEIKNVERKIKQLLQVNLPFIKVKQAAFNPDAIIPPYQLQDTNPYSETNTYQESYYGSHYIWDISDINYKNMHVTFNYQENWPIQLNIRPSKGKYLESNSQKSGQMMSLFCLHIWHFTYDMIFPVKVTIVDDETEDNERYSFNFAFKAQINHNTPERKNFATESFETRDTYSDEEYCADVTNLITIKALDETDSTAIRDVNITFICGRYQCDMGVTESDWESGGIPSLKKLFPYCANGIVRGNKQGFKQGERFIQTGRLLGTNPDDNIGGTFDFEMLPVKTLNYTVVKHNMLDDRRIGSAKKLEPDEQAIITIKNPEKQFTSYGTYPIDVNSPLELIDDNADYNIEIYVADNESISAGYKKTMWTVNNVDLHFGKNITFHVVGKDFEDDEERGLFFAGLESYSSNLILLPEIK